MCTSGLTSIANAMAATIMKKAVRACSATQVVVLSSSPFVNKSDAATSENQDMKRNKDRLTIF